jgi:excisionase family DNA binding protein
MTAASEPSTRPDLRARSTISVDEVAKVLGIGRSAAYEAVHRGQIPHVRIGRRYLVPVPRLLAMLGEDRAG